MALLKGRGWKGNAGIIQNKEETSQVEEDVF